jgi:hypothetical protein
VALQYASQSPICGTCVQMWFTQYLTRIYEKLAVQAQVSSSTNLLTKQMLDSSSEIVEAAIPLEEKVPVKTPKKLLIRFLSAI